MKRADCHCANERKPCSYHEGMEDAELAQFSLEELISEIERRTSNAQGEALIELDEQFKALGLERVLDLDGDDWGSSYIGQPVWTAKRKR